MEIIRSAPVDLEDHFRKVARRRVAKDRTVSLDGRIYEAPTKLIGEYIQLLYHHPDRLDRVEIFHQNTSQGVLIPVDLRVNCTVKRKRDQDQLIAPEETGKRCGSGKLSFAGTKEAHS